MNTLTIISHRFFDRTRRSETRPDGDYVDSSDYIDLAKDVSKRMVISGFDSLSGVLRWLFPRFPQGARLYHCAILPDCDITPKCEKDIDDIEAGKYSGDFFLMSGPEDIGIGWVVAIVIAAVTAVYLMKQVVVPNATSRNTNTQSSNNELSSRTNKPRPLGRIPHIYGTLNATPDLVTNYTHYIDNVEVEDCLMCLGVGAYTIHSVRDGETDVATIDRAAVCAYSPNTNIDGIPSYAVGMAAGAPFPAQAMGAGRSNSVNGQTLRSPGNSSYTGSNDIAFKYPNMIVFPSDLHFFYYRALYDATSVRVDDANIKGTIIYNTAFEARAENDYQSQLFVVPYIDDAQLNALRNSATVHIADAVYAHYTGAPPLYNLAGTYPILSVAKVNEGTEAAPVWRCKVYVNPSPKGWDWNVASTPTYNLQSSTVQYSVDGTETQSLDGVYTVSGIDDHTMYLSNPAAVNPVWNNLAGYLDRQAVPVAPTISDANASLYAGWFSLTNREINRISVNVVAMNGLYGKDTKNRTFYITVPVFVQIQQIDKAGNAIGSIITKREDFGGQSDVTLGRTYTYDLPASGYWRVRMYRGAMYTGASNWALIVDEVKWKDLYSLYDLKQKVFGDVTMIRSRTYATTGALAVKERKLNMLVTRKLPRRISGSDFTKELYPTNYAADIISDICLGHIGKLDKSNVDFDNIYDTCREIVDYFGIDEACEFSYTFDSDNLSLEETLSTVAQTIFCTAYRRGRVIRISFERENDSPVLLLNHRNKLPGTEKRTINFGYSNDHDGIEYQYVSPDDDAVLSLYLPEDRSALNPEKTESIGVRSEKQARLHAWRLYQKLKYQYASIETDCAQEATALLIGDKILVADNTRPETQDGDVTGVSDLVVFTSQDVALAPGIDHYAFIQHTDGSVESIKITAGPVSRSFTLARAPRLPLVHDDGAFTKTVYKISSAETLSVPVDEFLVSEISSEDNFTATVQAVNYDARYYAHDKDYYGG